MRQQKTLDKRTSRVEKVPGRFRRDEERRDTKRPIGRLLRTGLAGHLPETHFPKVDQRYRLRKRSGRLRKLLVFPQRRLEPSGDIHIVDT